MCLTMYMKMLFQNYLCRINLIVFIVFSFHRCAQIVPLTGGEKDTVPPKLVNSIPINYSKNFSQKKITLTFNEKIHLINPSDNIIITPALSEKPNYIVKNKVLEILLPNDKLLPHTTYKIIFNKAIADLTERNILNTMEYVFSTGSFIDSLCMKGQIKNAYTHSAEKEILVALYEVDKNDSVCLKERPLYFTRTAQDGSFTLCHLPSRYFKILAIGDQNNNLMYDPVKEKIGFLESPIHPEKDSVVYIRIAEEKPSQNFLKKYIVVNPYLLHLIYTFPDRYQLLNHTSNIQMIYSDSVYSDTCRIMFHHIDTAHLVIKNSTRIDTIHIPIPYKKSHSLHYTLLNQYNQKQMFFRPIELLANFWIDTAQLSHQIVFYQGKDSTHRIDSKYYTIYPHQITINYPLKPKETYFLKIPVKPISSKDSVSYQKWDITTDSPEQYAQLKINILFPEKKNYIVALCNTQHQIQYSKTISTPFASSNLQSIEFQNIKPDTYILKIIQDDNQNGQWDGPKYLIHSSQKAFAEKIFIYPQHIKLINNWDVVLDWKEVK